VIIFLRDLRMWDRLSGIEEVFEELICNFWLLLRDFMPCTLHNP
jgi:hypothetical protein